MKTPFQLHHQVQLPYQVRNLQHGHAERQHVLLKNLPSVVRAHHEKRRNC